MIAWRRLGIAGHCYRHRELPASQLVLWEPTHGRRKPGRPPTTFLNILQDDIGATTSAELPACMKDRKDWNLRREARLRPPWWWWWCSVWLFRSVVISAFFVWQLRSIVNSPFSVLCLIVPFISDYHALFSVWLCRLVVISAFFVLCLIVPFSSDYRVLCSLFDCAVQ